MNTKTKQEQLCPVSAFYKIFAQTENRFLPEYLRSSTNEYELACLKKVLAMTIEKYLLPEEQRLVQLLFYDELQGQEVAQQLGVSTSTVSRRLQKIVEKLQIHLGFFAEALRLVLTDSDLREVSAECGSTTLSA